MIKIIKNLSEIAKDPHVSTVDVYVEMSRESMEKRKKGGRNNLLDPEDYFTSCLRQSYLQYRNKD